jgi:hypothetical protein
MSELTITSPYVPSRVDSNTFTMGNPMPESTLNPIPEPTLSTSQGLWICLVKDIQKRSSVVMQTFAPYD